MFTLRCRLFSRAYALLAKLRAAGLNGQTAGKGQAG